MKLFTRIFFALTLAIAIGNLVMPLDIALAKKNTYKKARKVKLSGNKYGNSGSGSGGFNLSWRKKTSKKKKKKEKQRTIVQTPKPRDNNNLRVGLVTGSGNDRKGPKVGAVDGKNGNKPKVGAIDGKRGNKPKVGAIPDNKQGNGPKVAAIDKTGKNGKGPIVAPGKTGVNKAPPTVQIPKTKIKPKKLAGATGKDLNATIQQRNAHKAIQERQKKFEKPANISSTNLNTSSPLYTRATSTSRTHVTVEKTIVIKKDYYSNQRGWHEPDYVYSRSASGMWDGYFLGYATSRIGDPHYDRWAYSHWDDPGLRDWIHEMRQDKKNRELQRQLDLMEVRVADMERRGVARDEKYLPPDVPVEVAMATEIVADISEVEVLDLPVMHLATGDITGAYYEYGTYFAKRAKGFVVQVHPTAGSGYNADNYESIFDSIMIQSDMADKKIREGILRELGEYSIPVFNEPVQMFVNAKSGIKSAKDLRPECIIFTGPKDSGPEGSWENFKFHSSTALFKTKKYSTLKTITCGYIEALEAVASNKRAVLVYVGSLKGKLTKIADTDPRFAGKIRLAEFDDFRFDNAEDREGYKVYTKFNIPHGKFENLQRGRIIETVESLSVEGIHAISEKFIGEHPELKNNILAAASLAVGDMMDKE